MMFIIEFQEKLRHSANQQNFIEQVEAQWLTLSEHVQKMIVKWREIEKPGPAVQEQIWKFLYDYTKFTTTLVMLHGDLEFFDMSVVKSMMMELIFMLYPQEDYVSEIFSRIVFIAEWTTKAVKLGDHDRFSPLDTMNEFRRMLGRHLMGKDEIAGKLKRCREDYAAKIRRELHQVELEQSRYDSWEMRYLECERNYQQILNRIGKATRPAIPAIYSPRSPWELRMRLHANSFNHLQTQDDLYKFFSWSKVDVFRDVVGYDKKKNALRLFDRTRIEKSRK